MPRRSDAVGNRSRYSASKWSRIAARNRHDAITPRPSLRYSMFAEQADALRAFLGVLDWFCQTVRAS